MNEIKQVDLVNKNTAGSRIKKALKVIGMITFILFGTITIVLVVIGNWLSDFNDEVYSESKFDKEIWLQAGNSYYTNDSCIRGRMYYDLKKNYLKKGMSLNEIEELLGITNTRRLYEKNGIKKECLQYHLGFCAKLGDSTEILVFCPTKNIKWNYFISNHNDQGYLIY